MVPPLVVPPWVEETWALQLMPLPLGLLPWEAPWVLLVVPLVVPLVALPLVALRTVLKAMALSIFEGAPTVPYKGFPIFPLRSGLLVSAVCQRTLSPALSIENECLALASCFARDTH